jgi:uncharacterized protein YegL
MRGEKIGTVNTAVKEMIAKFKQIENPKGQINLCVITFGKSGAHIEQKLTPISEITSFDFIADGKTPMGQAFEVCLQQIEDTNELPIRSYSPSIILVSDGNPTDFTNYDENMTRYDIISWEPLKQLHSGSRSSTATRLAMGIGDDVDTNILKAFINDDTIPVIKATETDTIEKFFEWVSMSISVRSVSINPNSVKICEPTMFEEDEVEF